MKYNSVLIRIGVLLAIGTTVACAQTLSTPSEIPLASVHATFNQPGLQRAQSGPMANVEPGFARPLVMGFAWAADFEELTKLKFLPVPADDGKPEFRRATNAAAQLWVGVYFGSTGSSPPQFVIDAVKVLPANVIEVQYHKAPPGIVTRDLRPYAAWVPLGNLAVGGYTVRLVEAGTLQNEQKWSIVGTASQPAGGASTQIAFEITARKAQDKIEAQIGSATTAFTIVSPSGIGGATIKLPQGRWPASVLVRLKYDAQRPYERLEGFSAVAAGGTRFDEIRGRPTNLGMEVELPATLLQANPASIELSWVDMYR